MGEFFLKFLLIVVALFIIGLVLIQRGRGGGLVGALGGMGGQSAFGAKAGDIFTKITMWSAFVWIVLCALTTRFATTETSKFEGTNPNVTSPSSVGPSTSGKSTDGEKSGSTSSTPSSSTPATGTPTTGTPESPAKPGDGK